MVKIAASQAADAGSIPVTCSNRLWCYQIVPTVLLTDIEF